MDENLQPMDASDLRNLQKDGLLCRKLIIEMAARGGCFLGSAFSCVDIILYLYRRFLHISPTLLNDRRRDYFFLSKGHAVPALYSALTITGFLKAGDLREHLQTTSNIYWHPNSTIPGVEHPSGSLGQLLSIAIGVAIDIQRTNGTSKVVVLTGDGELNEGSVWESLLIASASKLTNLLIIVDRNGFQANFKTEDLIPLEPLVAKFEAFGCAVREMNGHDFEAIARSLDSFPLSNTGPSMLIANTIRGKGIPSIEGDWEKWFVELSLVEKKHMLGELNNHYRATAKR